jgi:hypothetical protein
VRRVVLLVVSGLLLGAALTGGAGALPGSQDLNALTWLGTVSTVAALVVAVGIYRVQQAQSDVAHQELLDALKAQDEILENLADTSPPPSETPASTPAPATPEDGLTDAQRAAVRARYGDRSITGWRFGGRRGDPSRLVRLDDGTLVSVFTDGRGEVRVREVGPRGDRRRPNRDPRTKGSTER